MNSSNLSIVGTYFPSQKKSDKEKNLQWMKDNVDAAEQIALHGNNTNIRNSMHHKRVNYNLYNGILDQQDIKELLNPYGIEGNFANEELTHYQIANPKINLLIGEELKRKFDFKVVVKNPDAISAKEKNISDRMFQVIANEIASAKYDEKTMKAKLEELDEWINYSSQDFREIMGTQSLQYLYREQNLKSKFNDGFKDVLLSGEEIYCCDIIAGNPVCNRVNPLSVYMLRMGDSKYVEDADMVITNDYYPLGSVIDMYYEDLTKENIKLLEEGADLRSSTTGLLNYSNAEYNMPIFATGIGSDENVMLGVNSTENIAFSGAFNQNGDVKVTRVVWRSLRKIGKLKFFDEDGVQQETIVPEQYVVNKDKGEVVEWLYIGEWWEGTKIANDIYVKMQPRHVQFRKMTNLSQCASGFVGTLYNTNANRVDALMDRLKPYAYAYDIYMDRVNKIFAKNPGVIGKLDLSRMPAGWTVEKWLNYAYTMGFVFEDSFNEVKKGSATGKLAGGMQQGQNILDFTASNYLQSHFIMIDRIKAEMDEISGVTRQRQGAVENRETVGGVERSVAQSSLITEEWFAVHDNTKLRVMETLLETAKIAYGESKVKIPFIYDDMTSKMFEFGGEDFRNSEYGLFVNNSSDDAELFSAMKRLAEAGLQNQKISYSQIIDMYQTQSTSSLARKLEKAEKKADKRQQDNFEAEQEKIQAKIDSDNATQERQFALDQYIVDSNNETKLRIAEIQSTSQNENVDLNNNGIPDAMEIAEMSLKERQQSSNEFSKQLDFDHKKKIDSRKLDLEEDKLKTTKEVAKIRADAEKYKIDKQVTIAKTNKNKK